MGTIKKAKQEEAEPTIITLKDEEFNYVMNVNMARNNVVQEYNRVISSFLHYIAVGRGVFESTDNLQFELDFEDENRRLKVWKIEENLFNSDEQ